MKTIGRRQTPPLTARASGVQLKAGAKFCETLARLSPLLGVPKGVYRYATHEAANLHWQECVAQNMVRPRRD